MTPVVPPGGLTAVAGLCQFRIAQDPLEGAARPVHLHLDRGRVRIGGLADLAVTQPIEIVQQDHASGWRRERFQGLQQDSLLLAEQKISLRIAGPGWLCGEVIHVHLDVRTEGLDRSLAPAGLVDTEVVGHSSHPGQNPFPFRGRAAIPQPHEDFLGDVLGILAVAQHVVSMAVDAMPLTC